MEKIKLKVYDLTTKKTFYTYFDTEFERDKFKRKLKYSKKLRVVNELED